MNIRKAIQFGYGLLNIGKDQLKTLSKDLKEKYDLDEKKSKKLAKEILESAAASHKQIEKIVEKQFKNLVKEFDLDKKPVKKKRTAKKKNSTKRKKPTKRTAKKKK